MTIFFFKLLLLIHFNMRNTKVNGISSLTGDFYPLPYHSIIYFFLCVSSLLRRACSSHFGIPFSLPNLNIRYKIYNGFHFTLYMIYSFTFPSDKAHKYIDRYLNDMNDNNKSRFSQCETWMPYQKYIHQKIRNRNITDFKCNKRTRQTKNEKKKKNEENQIYFCKKVSDMREYEKRHISPLPSCSSRVLISFQIFISYFWSQQSFSHVLRFVVYSLILPCCQFKWNRKLFFSSPVAWQSSNESKIEMLLKLQQQDLNYDKFNNNKFPKVKLWNFLLHLMIIVFFYFENKKKFEYNLWQRQSLD